MATRPLTHSTGRGTIRAVNKQHSVWALLLALVPAVALVVGLPFVNRLQPVVLGLPFLLAWILGWVLVTPVFLAAAYVLAERKDGGPRGGADR